MKRHTHSQWYREVTRLRSELTADPRNLELVNRLWALLSGSTGFDARTGRLLVETFRATALNSDAGMAALVTAFRRLTDETGEFPRAALFDPPLENLFRMRARDADHPIQDDINWILNGIEQDS